MWKTVKLGDVCRIVNGSTPSRTESRFWEDGDVSWFTIDDMREQGRDIFSTAQHVTQTAVEEKKAKLIPENSVLLCCTASIGEAAIARKEMATNQQFNALTPLTAELSCEYLYYVATTLKEKLLSVSGSTTISFVSMGKLKTIEIPLPPIAEQQRIVAKLDATFAEIDRAIEHTKEKQKTIENLTFITKKNYLEAEMSGAMTLLGESCEFFNGKAHEKDIDDEGKYVVVNSKFISSDGRVKKYTNELMFPLSQGDIVMVMSDVPNGKALAKTYLIEEEDKYSLNQRICCIRSTNYDPKYLKTIIDRNPHFLKRDNGENQTNLRKADILSCPLPVTTEKTQKEREKYLSSLTADLASILLLKRRIIDEYIKLKSAILAQELQPPQSEAA